MSLRVFLDSSHHSNNTRIIAFSNTHLSATDWGVFKINRSIHTKLPHHFNQSRSIDHNWNSKFISNMNCNSCEKIAHNDIRLDFLNLNFEKRLQCFCKPFVIHFIIQIFWLRHRFCSSFFIIWKNLVFATDMIQKLRSFMVVVFITICNEEHLMPLLNQCVSYMCHWNEVPHLLNCTADHS